MIIPLKKYKDSRNRIRGPGLYIFSKTIRKGKRKMLGGPYHTMLQAKKRERDIQTFKHKK